jgi:hypothetical protein
MAMVAAQHHTIVFCRCNFTSKDLLVNGATPAGTAGVVLDASTSMRESRKLRLSLKNLFLVRLG